MVGEGVCMVVGGMHGCGGVYMAARRHAWLPGGVHGCGWVCMVVGGAWLQGACLVSRGVHRI